MAADLDTLLARNGWDYAAWGAFCQAVTGVLAAAQVPMPASVLFPCLPAHSAMRDFESCVGLVPGIALARHEGKSPSFSLAARCLPCLACVRSPRPCASALAFRSAVCAALAAHGGAPPGLSTRELAERLQPGGQCPQGVSLAAFLAELPALQSSVDAEGVRRWALPRFSLAVMSAMRRLGPAARRVAPHCAAHRASAGQGRDHSAIPEKSFLAVVAAVPGVTVPQHNYLQWEEPRVGAVAAAAAPAAAASAAARSGAGSPALGASGGAALAPPLPAPLLAAPPPLGAPEGAEAVFCILCLLLTGF